MVHSDFYDGLSVITAFITIPDHILFFGKGYFESSFLEHLSIFCSYPNNTYRIFPNMTTFKPPLKIGGRSIQQF